MVFPIVMNGCERWTMKKTEYQRIDAFELWCWRRLLRIPWIARRPSQSILKEISPEYSLEGHAKAETQIFWPPDVRNWLTGKDPNAGKNWRWEKGMTGDERVGWCYWLYGHEFEQAPGAGDGQGSLIYFRQWVIWLKELDMTDWTKLSEISTISTKILPISLCNTFLNF